MEIYRDDGIARIGGRRGIVLACRRIHETPFDINCNSGPNRSPRGALHLSSGAVFARRLRRGSGEVSPENFSGSDTQAYHRAAEAAATVFVT